MRYFPEWFSSLTKWRSHCAIDIQSVELAQTLHDDANINCGGTEGVTKIQGFILLLTKYKNRLTDRADSFKSTNADKTLESGRRTGSPAIFFRKMRG